MSGDLKATYSIERYRPLGLIANPFALAEGEDEMNPNSLEIGAEGNELLGVVLDSSKQERAKPIVVEKAEGPSYMAARAIARVQRSLATDDAVDGLYAYIQLYMMRLGRIRATLGTLGERLAFRDFAKTLETYLGTVLAEPDEALASYQVLGTETLEAFAARFAENPAEATEALFGPFAIEKRPELAQVTDLRLTNLEPDVDEDDAAPEIDAGVGDAPGTDVVLAEEADAHESEDSDQELVDYIVEYTQVHLSPVIARGFRVVKERGLAAMATEFKVTKAPRKTLKALVKLARLRFSKVIFIFDGFEGWGQAPDELRSQVAAALAEMRWMLETDGLFVLMLEEGLVPEIEEQYASARRVEWDFPGLEMVMQAPDSLIPELVNHWLAAATVIGETPMTLEDPTLSKLAEAANGDLNLFSAKAYAAIEDAAERGATSLDDAALAAGLAMELPEAQLQ